MNVVALPTRITVDELWCRYCALIQQSQDRPALLTDLAHNQAIARSWSAWRDAFLASERKC
ncbi:hypothetical protein [Sphingomonas panaciterrae]|uniref:hypothetical protein n=1 Tax=Sphingomonas panaciterrae TaxID=1462999 RepID=UPI002FF2F8F3